MSRYYQGKYQPINLQKYIGDPNKIRYLSSWELKFFKWADHSPKVLRWNSEDLIVKYLSPVDNKVHRYLVDIYFEILDKDGVIKKKMVEIKPANQCKPPRKSKNENSYQKKLRTWAVNSAKWEYARDYAKRNNMDFHIITEKELNIK